ncbi:MAG: AzlD domain-containing protein [Proteobacteria bacterium]|nr:MAG: AzlD domain-containing protein [Pseudomonadota bacterium]
MTSATLWILIVLCALATFVWRLLGVAFARRIDPAGPLFQWITCVSYAMVAGLVFRMIVLPTNELAMVPLWIRLGSVAVAFAAYVAFGSRLLPGVLAGSGLLAALVWMSG